MAKGIIVVEMPESCAECPLKSQLYDTRYICTASHRRFSMFAQNKPDWCPMRPMPEKPEYPPLGKSSYVAGWNDCVDYLEGRNGQ